MGKKRTRNVCRVLYVVAIVVYVVSVLGIVCTVLMMSNGRMWAVLPFAGFVALVWLADELAEAAEKRMG